MPKRDYATSTFGKTLHLYANSATGDDGYNGLSSGTAVQTLAAAAKLIPDVLNDHVVLNLSGTFTIDHMLIGPKLNYKRLIIDGGSDVTSIAGPFTATASDTGYLTVASAGWTPNAYKGYLIKINSGGSAGQTRMVHSNTADTVYATKNWGSAPGTIEFEIVRPTTTITSSGFKRLIIAPTGTSYMHLQRLYIAGDVFLNVRSVIHQVYLVHTIMASSSYVWAQQGILGTDFTRRDPTNPDTTNTTEQAAFSYLGSSGSSIYAETAASLLLLGAVLTKKVALRGASIYTNFGSSFLQIEAYGNLASDYPENKCIETNSGYATTTINNNDGPGLVLLSNSAMKVAGAVSISGSTHAIEVNKSELNIDGAVTGYGAAGAGLYAHNGSVITMKNGSTPTITGTVGDIAVNNPNYEDTTWSEIDAGDDLHSAQEATIIREVA